MHKISTRQNLKELLERIKINPNDNAEGTNPSNFAATVYPNEYSDVGSPAFDIVPEIKTEDGQFAYGSVPTKYTDAGSVYKLVSIGNIQLAKIAFQSNLRLAETIGHELSHYYDHFFGCYASWANSHGGSVAYASAVSEVNAWNWSHNWNQNNGTFLALAKYKKILTNLMILK